MAVHRFLGSDGQGRLVLETGWYLCVVTSGKTKFSKHGTEIWDLTLKILLAEDDKFVGKKTVMSIWFTDENAERLETLWGALYPDMVNTEEEVEAVAEDQEGKRLWVKTWTKEIVNEDEETETRVYFVNHRKEARVPRSLREKYDAFIAASEAVEEQGEPLENL